MEKKRIQTYTSSGASIFKGIPIFLLLLTAIIYANFRGAPIWEALVVASIITVPFAVVFGLFVGIPVTRIRASHIYRQKEQNMTATG